MTQLVTTFPYGSLAQSDVEGVPTVQRSSLLSEVPDVVHGITHRVVGMGLADGNVGYSAPRDRDDAWAMRVRWSAAAGLRADDLVVAYQVHGAGVAVAGLEDRGRGARPGSTPLAQADALVTAAAGPVLMTLHADCMPILLCDPELPAVATIHAGWRGTAADVAGETVRAMAREFGCVPSRMLAYLGPAIGGCCYDVGADVVDAWRDAVGHDDATAALRDHGGKTHFDGDRANRWLLQRAGLRPDLIESAVFCTRCDGEGWFSHRGQGPLTGRYGAMIAIRERAAEGG